MFLYRKSTGSSRSQFLPVVVAVGDAQDPVRQPFLEVFDAPGPFVIFPKKCVVASAVTLHRGGMRTARLVNYRRNQKSRNERAIGIRGNSRRLHDFFRDNN